MPYGNRTPYYKICPICNKEYKVAFWELNLKKTCSMECSREYRRRLPINWETVAKAQKTKKGKYLREKSSQWKGESASYSSQHEWIRKNSIIPLFCQKCGKETKLDASNISGKYKREISDYEWLCRKCHLEKDGVSDKERMRKIQRLSVISKMKNIENRKGI
jgi:hypothetical protein